VFVFLLSSPVISTLSPSTGAQDSRLPGHGKSRFRGWNRRGERKFGPWFATSDATSAAPPNSPRRLTLTFALHYH
jgi:hypothetical protein